MISKPNLRNWSNQPAGDRDLCFGAKELQEMISGLNPNRTTASFCFVFLFFFNGFLEVLSCLSSPRLTAAQGGQRSGVRNRQVLSLSPAEWMHPDFEETEVTRLEVWVKITFRETFGSVVPKPFGIFALEMKTTKTSSWAMAFGPFHQRNGFHLETSPIFCQFFTTRAKFREKSHKTNANFPSRTCFLSL